MRYVLRIECLAEEVINHIILIWTIRFNVKQVKQKPLKVCITLFFFYKHNFFNHAGKALKIKHVLSIIRAWDLI